MHVVERNRVAMIFHFLAETVCQPSEAAHVHAQGQILALHEDVLTCFGSGLPLKLSCRSRCTGPESSAAVLHRMEHRKSSGACA